MRTIEGKVAFIGCRALGLAAFTIVAACGGDAWLEESNPSGNAFFDSRLAGEIHSFWYVLEPQIKVAEESLRTQSIVAISAERAASLTGSLPDVPAGESLYLIRAVDVPDRSPVRIYQVGSWVQVSVEAYSTCPVFPPTPRRQPIVVSLAQQPTRLRLIYECNR